MIKRLINFFILMTLGDMVYNETKRQLRLKKMWEVAKEEENKSVL